MGDRPSDDAVGSFTADGPWVVEPDAMPWRNGIHALRESAQDRAGSLVERPRIPPARLLRVAAELLVGTAPWMTSKRLGREPATANLARSLHRAFGRLGPTYVKFGQLIASADGMAPDEFVREFKGDLDQVTPVAYDRVRKVVEDDLGRPLGDVFSSFSPTPIASASIAQVHAATLCTGEEVVVKVQRPNVASAMAADLRSLAWLIPVIEARAPQAALANLPAYLELFAETLVEELDFRLEAQNMLDIAAVLARSGHRQVVVPRPHPEIVSARVLVMERLRGFKMTDTASMNRAGIDPTDLFNALVVSFSEGAGIHGVFHGDVHGGNMMVLEDGRLALLDFGITGRFDDEGRIALMRLLLSGLSGGVRSQVAAFCDLGGLPPDTDVDELIERLGLDRLESRAEQPSDEMTADLRTLLAELVANGARLPKPLFLYLKGMVYLNGALVAISSDLDMVQALSGVMAHFNTHHHETFARDFGVDLSELDFEAFMRERMGDSGSLEEHRAKRMGQLRGD